MGPPAPIHTPLQVLNAPQFSGQGRGLPAVAVIACMQAKQRHARWGTENAPAGGEHVPLQPGLCRTCSTCFQIHRPRYFARSWAGLTVAGESGKRTKEILLLETGPIRCARDGRWGFIANRQTETVRRSPFVTGDWSTERSITSVPCGRSQRHSRLPALRPPLPPLPLAGLTNARHPNPACRPCAPLLQVRET